LTAGKERFKSNKFFLIFTSWFVAHEPAYMRCWSAINNGSNPFCERFFISKQNVHTFFVHRFVEENFFSKKTYTLFSFTDL